MAIKEELPPGEVPPEEIQEANALVSRTFSDMFKSTIGPLGSKKLITGGATKLGVDDLVTSNAYSVIRELKYMHPTADLLINAGLVQGERVGDGIATVMILTGELVWRGFELRSMGIHQNVIVRGYEKALERAKEVLNEIASPVEIRESDEYLKKVAKTALKKEEYYKNDRLVEAIVKGIKRISESGESPIDVDDVVIEAKSGGRVEDTCLLEGVVVDREVLDDLPRDVEHAKIALLDFPIEHKEPRVKGRKELPTGTAARERSKAGETLGALDFHVKLSKASHLREFRDVRARIFNELVDGVLKSGANVVCSRWGVDEDALDKFRRAGVMLIKRVKMSDLKRLERSTGGKVVQDVSDLTGDKLGFAGRVVEREVGGVKYVFFEDCPYKKSSTILIRGAHIRVLEGMVGDIKSALHAVARLYDDARVVPGGGAAEIECAVELRNFARTIPSKEQIAVNAFADALECIPKAIAKNSGMDEIDTLTALRAEHYAGNKHVGISGNERTLKDMLEEGIVDPLAVKLQAVITAASAAAGMIKIDDLHIARSEVSKEAEDREAMIAGRTRELIETERKPPEFKFKGGRLKYTGTKEGRRKSVYGKD
ncbi:MAG: TCP-1/cpn60 chaperonin family protein [Candidatus Methanospirareceae archaeon]